MNYDEELTLLTEDQVNESEIFKKYGTRAAITDFAVLLGGFVRFEDYHTSEGESLEDRCCYYWTKTSDNDGDARAANNDGIMNNTYVDIRRGAVRPALLSSSIVHSPNGVRGKSGVTEVQYGEYPQQAVSERLSRTLEDEYQSKRLKRTGKTYTTDSRQVGEYDKDFKAQQHEEFEYNGKKYVRVIANLNDNPTVISNGETIRIGDAVWVEVEPITWLIDEQKNLAVSKKGIVGGIRFYKSRGNWKGNFNNTEMNMFLQTYLKKDMVATQVKEMTPEEKREFEARQKELEKRRNPYGLNFTQASEEDIIRGAIESGVAVFLHGPSSEGKSARVKQIDPTCEIIYLRNASPESLNGKSVYNATTGEMIDVKPSWLKKIEEKCEKEPDRYHIVFLDEITNALPSIQGIAFNIVLDREVNGIWKLPANARIVAAGNDMKDSLAANQLAEPLFNRFAHVYIKTTTESWLRWASEHNIHPAIYSYIAYKKGETLRSKYDGEKPNADPRKWEMASKMLYATGQPEMLRALVGEDITREFVSFCNQRVITLNDVISGSVTERDIQALNTAERYATTMGLSQADDTNLEKVRGFVIGMGAEFGAIFDALWTHGDESRLERIAEAKLATREEGGIRK